MPTKNKFLTVSLIATALLITAILWIYWPILVNLATDLATNEDYSFGLLLPLVTCYVVYLKWPQIRQQTWQPSWLGLVIIALGFGLMVFGELVSVFYLGPVSFMVVITGLIFLRGGWRLVRVLAFPILLLFLMIPPPSLVTKQLTLPLQLLSSRLAAGFLQAAGIPLLRHGNVIDMGVAQLQVVDACSGLRYIVSLAALGIIFCYFYQRRLWKAVTLIVFVIPAAILANALRVAAMGLYPALQKGFLHSFSGWLIFIFCFGVLVLLNYILNYLQPQVSQPVLIKADVPKAGAPRAFRRYALVALGLVCFLGFLTHRLTQTPAVPLLQSFDAFPMQIGPWTGQREFLDAAMAKAVGADDYLEASFSNRGHDRVSLWMAFFEKQEKETDKRIHSPILCLTGSGWQIIDSKIVDIAPGLPVQYLLIEQGNTRQVVYFWYYQRGRWLASEYSRYFYMGFDGLFRRRNDGAIVRLITPVGKEVQPAQERLRAFAHLLIPILNKFIPQ
jgi:exosortase D (VPLPA-CTERM-specific)